jgi:hypothetical protein
MIENNYKHGESMKLDDEAIADYLRDNIIPGFLPLLNQQVYSVIFNRYHEFVICTNLSANSIGFVDWQTAQGLSIKDHSNDEKIRKVFGALYTPEFARLIHRYAEDVCELQNQVFKSGKMVSFMDLLPYNGKFSSFLINYVPIFHPNGEVIAIQSFAIASRLFSHQEFLLQIMEENEINCGDQKISLTQREQEIMFLVANGITQDQMAQILNLHRSTIANIISKQLCVKFGLAGSRTKELGKIAQQYDFHQKIPRSLYRPFIVVLNQDLA